ncbi:TldD/PmbA family protein [Leptolyngbya sp. PCC 6406]|uniref:TldD/PmbA family protein n=1 Tax=Leptolyngbya sp. PCC 6406 TaxID=1173264 RepID=UPI0021F15F8F|nr:TldD/PmbA family protein [Leptolyngbya sp. PCC 6406]
MLSTTPSALVLPDIPDLLTETLDTLDIPADWVGIRAVVERGTQRSLRDGLPETNHRSCDRGAMVEVLVQGQLGYAATNNLTVAGLRTAAMTALQQAQAAASWGLYPFPAEVRPPVSGIYYSPVTTPLDRMTAGAVNDLLTRICQGLKVSDQIVQAQASISTREVETWLVSTKDSHIHQHFSFLTCHFGATAQDGPVVQTRSYNGPRSHCYQGGWEHLAQDETLWAAVNQVGEQAVELLTAADCPETTTTLVLSPDQMMLQIHESIGHPLELDRILGDERNYAGGSFVQPEDFGTLQYGSDLLNVTFDPTVEQEFASYAFDDTGAVAERQYLIRQGKLERGLGSLESQTRLGVPGVACARATSWDRPPIDRMANINVEPGNLPFADLIATIEDGVYMEANRSWSIDDQRYKFQFGCEYARRIRRGQLAETLRNPNYRATTPQFWRSLVQVGDRDTWQAFGTPFCGKGEPNQIIRVGHGAPVCAFANIEVFGGAG